MMIWTHPHPLVLASASPTRRHLLAQAGLDVEVVPPGVDERAVEASRPHADAAQRASLLAQAKARAVSESRPGQVVLGADQTLSYGTGRFHKPANREEAVEQILTLSGRTHGLHSAAALIVDGHVLAIIEDEARLTMRRLTRTDVDAYVTAAGAAATASVGGYQIEGLGIHLFESIVGDHTTILGLPMLPLLRELRRLDLVGR